ncbi:hypothetical protein [Nannocystis pusilla]|uniref:hypothetical protein n=1 Tax=Nannocystis pusilla TaxID=889268 RepID=UPI003DA2AD6E
MANEYAAAEDAPQAAERDGLAAAHDDRGARQGHRADGHDRQQARLGYKAPRIESLLLLSQAFGCDPSELLPKTKHRNSGKSELLNELAVAATQLGAKQLRELIKQARGMEPG